MINLKPKYQWIGALVAGVVFTTGGVLLLTHQQPRPKGNQTQKSAPNTSKTKDKHRESFVQSDSVSPNNETVRVSVVRHYVFPRCDGEAAGTAAVF